MQVPSRRVAAPDLPSWCLILAMALTFLTVQYRDPFGVDALRATPAAVMLAALAGARHIGYAMGRPRLAVGATAFLQMTLFTLLGVVLAYALAAHGGTLWDARLARADATLGIDWPWIRALVDRSPPTIWLLGFAYHSLTVQMILVIVVLSATSRFDTLRTMVCAAILSGFVTVLISGLIPAAGNLFDPAQYRHLWPSIAWLERGLIAGLRDGSLRMLDLTMLMGIVSFPSFHATLAAIFIWALRGVPRLAWPGGVWAVLTIVATPLFGGHYGVDVLAGLMLAPPTIRISQAWTMLRSGPAPDPEPEPLAFSRQS